MRTVLVFLGTGIAALLASACCWLPALLGAGAVGSLGISSVLSPWRPYLLGFTGLFLLTGFWLVYRKPASTHERTCCTDSSMERKRKISIYVMWVVAFFSSAMAAYPYFQTRLYRASHSVPEQQLSGQQVILSVEGMDCEACAIAIEENLKKLPGVLSVVVDYANKRVYVTLGEPAPSEESLILAVHRSGFKAKVTKS